MGCRLVAMRNDPGDLGLKQGDTRIEFVVRITVERFRGQLAGQIAFRARALIKFHHRALCGC